MVLEIKWPEGGQIPVSQVNMKFIQGMADRMAMSYHKHGDMRKAPGTVFDHMANIQKRIELYKQTGNTEWLMDAANFCMIEFTNPYHPEAHYSPTDSDASPGIKYVGGQWVDRADTAP